MFGFSFGELMVLLIVGLIVLGPKELPKVLRKVGQWAGKLRAYALDMRAQSGIDEVLRSEGLDREIMEIRKLARGDLGGVVASVKSATRFDDTPYTPALPPADDPNAIAIDREREQPREGADAYGALPDTAIVYVETLPKSRFVEDATYTQGIPTPEPERAAGHEVEGETHEAPADEPEHEPEHEHVNAHEQESHEPTGTE